MKAVLQLTFIFFYVASASAASQIKTVKLVKKLLHSDSHDEQVSIERWCGKDVDNFPRYREAKKAPSDFLSHIPWSAYFTPSDVEILRFHDVSRRFEFTQRPSHSRAPPSLI